MGNLFDKEKYLHLIRKVINTFNLTNLYKKLLDLYYQNIGILFKYFF